jgi:hypothetical protein
MELEHAVIVKVGDRMVYWRLNAGAAGALLTGLVSQLGPAEGDLVGDLKDPNESRAKPTVHRPENDDVMGQKALCGATFSTEDDGVLRMHVFDYNCSECKKLSGEKG